MKKVGPGPVAIAITPDGKTVYLANWWPGSVTPMSTATNKPGKKIEVGDAPTDIVFDRNPTRSRPTAGPGQARWQ